ncbi:hypothetical protein PACTADRAFT_32251 [Pachysolen tannophilus NRRL Y-2460]|uniref:Extracellular mutant protein 11 C-terminal domain-containing protein n=1 Tax=Pachysolen tannophilus NRRL Y-2460 TaxID=669874 RepID=A0A1E4TYB7_PACTA|nr:hypothetical protein PACTADRAFT_32251 [Pachysolen tannophilus NRRL Y-2460]
MSSKPVFASHDNVKIKQELNNDRHSASLNKLHQNKNSIDNSNLNIKTAVKSEPTDQVKLSVHPSSLNKSLLPATKTSQNKVHYQKPLQNSNVNVDLNKKIIVNGNNNSLTVKKQQSISNKEKPKLSNKNNDILTNDYTSTPLDKISNQLVISPPNKNHHHYPPVAANSTALQLSKYFIEGKSNSLSTKLVGTLEAADFDDEGIDTSSPNTSPCKNMRTGGSRRQHEKRQVINNDNKKRKFNNDKENDIRLPSKKQVISNTLKKPQVYQVETNLLEPSSNENLNEILQAGEELIMENNGIAKLASLSFNDWAIKGLNFSRDYEKLIKSLIFIRIGFQSNITNLKEIIDNYAMALQFKSSKIEQKNKDLKDLGKKLLEDFNN